MTVAMALPLVLSVLLGASASRFGRRLPPATAVRLLTAAMLVSALSTGFVLAVAGTLVLAQIPLVAALGHYSARVVGAENCTSVKCFEASIGGLRRTRASLCMWLRSR